MSKTAAEMTVMNRAELRRIGLNSAGVVKLYEEAATLAAQRDGCRCGLLHIHPRRSADDPLRYDVQMFHATTCPAHPLRAAEARAKAERSLRARLRRLTRRG